MTLSREPRLNIAAWAAESVVNGPGKRFVLWLQGCPLHCPVCINPDYIPQVSRKHLSVSETAAYILSIPNLEGITYSGGEPTLQAEALALLNDKLRMAGLTIVSYSGYTLADLQKRPESAIAAFLDGLDILIDGPYQQTDAASLPWRGSRNQQIHFLTPTYQHLAEMVKQEKRHIELIAGEEQWFMTGTWTKTFWTRLQKVLAEGEENG